MLLALHLKNRFQLSLTYFGPINYKPLKERWNEDYIEFILPAICRGE